MTSYFLPFCCAKQLQKVTSVLYLIFENLFLIGIKTGFRKPLTHYYRSLSIVLNALFCVRITVSDS